MLILQNLKRMGPLRNFWQYRTLGSGVDFELFLACSNVEQNFKQRVGNFCS